MSAALAHSIGPNTVDDWLAQDSPADGSRLELIWGYFHVTPPPGGPHQFFGDELRTTLRSACRAAGRTDLYPVTGVGVRISNGMRTALIPDVSVLNVRPTELTFGPEQVTLAVEIWSPGNAHGERASKAGAYAEAGIPFFWAVAFNKLGSPTITPYRLHNGDYVADPDLPAGTTGTITASPVPVTFDPADLLL